MLRLWNSTGPERYTPGSPDRGSNGDACFQCLGVPAANERWQHGLIAAGRDAGKMYSVLERLAKSPVIGRLRFREPRGPSRLSIRAVVVKRFQANNSNFCRSR